MEKNLTLYEKIREDILSGKFGDNEKMTEIRLAKNYEVSRTPIREVLRQLEFEYLIKDGYIYKPSPEDYRNLIEMRTLIEAHAVEKAILLFGQSDIDDLRNSVEKAHAGPEDETMAANKYFHEKLIRLEERRVGKEEK